MSSTTPESTASKINESAVENPVANEQQTNVDVPIEQQAPSPKEEEVLEKATETQDRSGDPTAAINEQDVSIEETSPSAEDSKPLTKFEESLQLRDKMESLIRRTVQTKKRCDKLDHDNKYLQEYVGNLMNSGDFLSKRV